MSSDLAYNFGWLLFSVCFVSALASIFSDGSKKVINAVLFGISGLLLLLSFCVCGGGT